MMVTDSWRYRNARVLSSYEN